MLLAAELLKKILLCGQMYLSSFERVRNERNSQDKNTRDIASWRQRSNWWSLKISWRSDQRITNSWLAKIQKTITESSIFIFLGFSLVWCRSFHWQFYYVNFCHQNSIFSSLFWSFPSICDYPCICIVFKSLFLGWSKRGQIHLTAQ